MAALSHVKNVTIADFTGTVTVFNSAGATVTANATDIVRPTDWVSVHNFFNTISGNTAGSSTAIGTNLVFGGTGALTLSHSTAAGAATMYISAPQTSSLSATGQVSISTNGSTISIGVPNAVTYSRYAEFKEADVTPGQVGQGTLHFQPWLIPNLHYDRVCFDVNFSNASNSSGSITLSMWFGVYTKNASTLSLASSTSISYGYTASGTVGNFSLVAGPRNMTIGSTNTITEGMYWLGVVSRTTSGGANASISQFLVSQLASNHSGIWGQASATSAQWMPGMGVYSASTSAMPASVAFSQIQGSASLAMRPPSLFFLSGTV